MKRLVGCIIRRNENTDYSINDMLVKKCKTVEYSFINEAEKLWYYSGFASPIRKMLFDKVYVPRWRNQ